MRVIDALKRRIGSARRQRGSALLVSLMVMVGLSLLGLAFVALSETENAISINERNHAQTVAIAEAGAKLVVQWFQQPSVMLATPTSKTTAVQNYLMPKNEQAIKTSRAVDLSGTTGYYRPSGTLFNTPFGPAAADLFLGDEDHPDVLINATTLGSSATSPVQTAFLDDVNQTLFSASGAANVGQITELAIYSPPVVGSTHVGGSYIGGQRFGIATVKATAQKKDSAGNVIAQAVVRLVLGPFPLPGPTGAIQSIGGIGSNGNFDVHWGAVESEVSIDLTKSGLNKNGVPWFNAWDIAHIERGYDSSTTWTSNTHYLGNTTFPLGAVVRPTSSAPAGAQGYEYVAVQAGDGVTGGSEPTWPTDWTTTVPDGTVTWKRRPKTMFPLKDVDATNYDNHNWLYEIVSKDIEDPWFAMRSWSTVAGGFGGTATSCCPASPHPYPYAVTPVPTAWLGANWFQNQTFNSYPNYKKVEVPRFDYDVWKAAALAGRGQPGVHYLFPSGTDWTDGVATKSMSSWVTNANGFYFFETTNMLNPQNGGAGTLTDGAVPCGFRGFLYMNATQIPPGGGCSSPTGYYPLSGEPFRDSGYRYVVETTSGSQTRGEWATDAAGNYITVGAYDGFFSYQDLDWSDSGNAAGSGSTAAVGTKNKIFDVYVAQKTVKRESDSATITEWFPVEYYPGCKPGNNNACASCNCSEPHEPYMNIRYPDPATGITNPGGGSPVFNAVQLGWRDPTLAGRPKKTDTELPNGTLVTCAAADQGTLAGQANCTSNAYDYLGSMVQLAPDTEGVVYNEGNIDVTGNANYYGSLVLGGSANPTGTVRIWYDERLVKGGWPPSGVNFPRVMITSEQVQ